jgi:hypothetical protein
MVFSTDLRGQEGFRLIPGVKSALGMEWGNLWITGDMLIPAGGRPGSGDKIALSEDLGMDQSEQTSFSLRSEVLNDHLFQLSFLAYAPTGSKRAPRSFRFHNKTYAADTPVESKLDINWFRFVYAYKAIDVNGFWFAPSIGLNYLQNVITLNGMTEEAGTISNTRRLDASYPVLGFGTGLALPYGLDFGLQIEGVHMITRGFMADMRLEGRWEAHTDMLFTIGLNAGAIKYLEDNQPLNNEWYYLFSGWSAGVAFSF